MTEIVRVLRVIEYIGNREWVEETVSRSVHGTKHIGKDKFIRAATIGNYPEILENFPLDHSEPISYPQEGVD